MSKRELVTLIDVALITCVVQRGLGDTVVAAATEAGAQGATVSFGRGTGVRERLGVLGLAVEVEKEIVTILVAEDQVDRVFESIHVAARLDTPGMGVMYVTPVEKMATYVPHDVVERLTSKSSS
ncbi:MAG: P-II family nitrogen regulator [Acidobacteriota bacterium]